LALDSPREDSDATSSQRRSAAAAASGGSVHGGAGYSSGFDDGIIPPGIFALLGFAHIKGEYMAIRRQSVVAFLIIVIFGSTAWGADAAPTTQADNAGLETCLAAAADGSSIYPSDHFPRAKEINATFRLGDAHGGELEFNWVAVDVGDAAPANFTIASGTLDIHNATCGTVSMNGLEQPLPVGKYRQDVSIDHQPWKSRDFSMIAPLDAPNVQNPQDLVPLTPGKKWTYKFVQEAANGATLTGPGIKLDPDGKMRATVEITHAGDDDKGSHMELRRDGNLVFSEWWRLGSDGLTATQRKSTDQVVSLQPPQVLLPWPLEPKTWSYEPDDHSYKQTCRMWGPLPVQGPSGEVPGYVVMIVQTDGLSKTSDERHFIPGLGLAKEVIVNTINEKLVDRTVMTLEKTE
jgi:hypothetical protein